MTTHTAVSGKPRASHLHMVACSRTACDPTSAAKCIVSPRSRGRRGLARPPAELDGFSLGEEGALEALLAVDQPPHRHRAAGGKGRRGTEGDADRERRRRRRWAAATRSAAGG